MESESKSRIEALLLEKRLLLKEMTESCQMIEKELAVRLPILEREKRSLEGAEQYMMDKETEVQQREDEINRMTSQIEPAVEEARGRIMETLQQGELDLGPIDDPPVLKKKVLYAVVCLLEGRWFHVSDWHNAIVTRLRRPSFFQKILDFDYRSVTPRHAARLRHYLAGIRMLQVNRLPPACGDLFRWTLTQMMLCDVRDRFAPAKLRFPQEMEVIREKIAQSKTLIEDLEKQIEQLQAQYAAIGVDYEQIEEEIAENEAKLQD